MRAMLGKMTFSAGEADPDFPYPCERLLPYPCERLLPNHPKYVFGRDIQLHKPS